jgi:hypothetical protein
MMSVFFITAFDYKVIINIFFPKIGFLRLAVTFKNIDLIQKTTA